MNTPDPRLVAHVNADALARHAYHLAGNAVAVVLRGGLVTEVFLPTFDWTVEDGSADSPGDIQAVCADEARPFITYAGMWAEAMWTDEQDPDGDEFDDAFACAWDQKPGAAARYEQSAQILNLVGANLGLEWRNGRPWEDDWQQELDHLWAAVCKVARLLIDGHPVTDDTVVTALRNSQC